MSQPTIRPHRQGDRLAVLMPGLGAVATTAIAGVEAVKRGLAEPIGSLTQTRAPRRAGRQPPGRA